jgi:hypothetical protein
MVITSFPNGGGGGVRAGSLETTALQSAPLFSPTGLFGSALTPVLQDGANCGVTRLPVLPYRS